MPKVDSEDHSTRGRPVAEQILAVDCLEAAAVVESVIRLLIVCIPAAAASLATPLPVLFTVPLMETEPAEDRPEVAEVVAEAVPAEALPVP